jgi:hypothetical protein
VLFLWWTPLYSSYHLVEHLCISFCCNSWKGILNFLVDRELHHEELHLQ